MLHKHLCTLVIFFALFLVVAFLFQFILIGQSHIMLKIVLDYHYFLGKTGVLAQCAAEQEMQFQSKFQVTNSMI